MQNTNLEMPRRKRQILAACGACIVAVAGM